MEAADVGVAEVEVGGDEGEYGPSESAVALLFNDDRPAQFVGID